MSQYSCTSCGMFFSKWSGKCEGCGGWNTIAQAEHATSKKTPQDIFEQHAKSDIEFKRLLTHIGEFDRVCGGGLVPGSVILVGGDPGIGKSTLMLQIASIMSQKHVCAYVSGEEGILQINMRAQRLNLPCDQCLMTTVTNVVDLISAFEKSKELKLVVIDSVQTMVHPSVDAYPGSMAQIRAVTNALVDSAKRKHYVVLLIGHVTKEGIIAGPKILEHMVDTVLYFDSDKQQDFRILRSIKNRFGPTNEIGIFEMTQKGLCEVKNPSGLFLSGDHASGTAVCAGIEGTRPILYEIQTLVTNSNLAAPRRISVGIDQNRLSMLVAVLQSRCKLALFNKDIYLNVSGGLRLSETASDLAVVAALISATQDKPVPADTIYFGEVSLSGKIRAVSQAEQRIKEAKKLGFSKICHHGNIEHVKSLL